MGRFKTGDPPTTFIPTRDDKDIQKWFESRQTNIISSDEDSSSTSSNSNNSNQNAMLQSLALNIQQQTDLFEKMRQEKDDEKEEKKNKYLELHDSSQLLILNASSIDGEQAESDPIESCKTFFNKKNINKAMDYLLTSLTHDFECCVSIDTGLVTALYSGHFLREREDSPSNFSFFLTPKKQALSSDNFKPTMILQLKASQGKGWSETDLKEALKQGIVTPSTVHSFTHQLRNFWGLSAFFFGKRSVLSESLSPLMSKINDHLITFEAAQLRDPNFTTKLGYAIDTRVFRWLQQCQTQRDRRRVNGNLLGFEPIFDNVLTDSFVQNLPTTFRDFKHPPKVKEGIEVVNENDGQNPRKRMRPNNPQNENKKVVNSSPIAAWMINNEDYNKAFAGRNLELRPKLKLRPMCQRFHSKGYCFDNCSNKSTHIPSEDIDKRTRDLYSKYVNKCKAAI